MVLQVRTGSGEYPIFLERGVLQRAGEILPSGKKVFIVTDSGVPAVYAETVAGQCDCAGIETIPQGEASKTAETLLHLLKRMVECGLTRSDCVAAVGGGVVGDLAGFAAACYMRGIGFYNIPTTVLSQVDSSIGGKVAVDFEGYKNLMGAFYPPKAVAIDPETLQTLSRRQISNGLAEAVKMSLTSDEALFRRMEEAEDYEEILRQIPEIIEASLKIKRSVVEQDEKEGGLRKILNFGHTLGHAIESVSLGQLYHGECVALGMLPMCSEAVRRRLIPVLTKLSLPTSWEGEADRLMEAMGHDKKRSGRLISTIRVERPGSFEIREIPMEELEQEIRSYFRDGGKG